MQSRADVVRMAYNFNCPPLAVSVKEAPVSFFRLDSPSVILETVKAGEPPLRDGQPADNKKTVIRLFESCGGRSTAKIYTRLPYVSVQECDGLEEAVGPVQQLLLHDGELSFESSFKPFQVRSFILFY